MPAGAITLYNALGSADVIVDVEGYFSSPPGGGSHAGEFHTPAAAHMRFAGQYGNGVRRHGQQSAVREVARRRAVPGFPMAPQWARRQFPRPPAQPLLRFSI